MQEGSRGGGRQVSLRSLHRLVARLLRRGSNWRQSLCCALLLVCGHCWCALGVVLHASLCAATLP